ncbi:MAG: toxin VasX [Pseudomonas sp.]|uniref:toxin VasX n=1 Tax=Pseudomonas sp. TaxID=306 RepID=UPI003D0E31B7
MTTSNQNQALNLAAANQAAKQNFRGEDLGSSVSACPARQAEVFVVPVRYALAELPAEHPCVKPACASQSHAMALRQLRPGYLYLWHEQGPLKRYAVAADGKLLEQGLDDAHAEISSGALAGLALNKAHDAWLFYSERPLPPATHERLSSDQAERRQRMRRLALANVAKCLEAEHCPPLKSAEQVIAELIPKVRELALAHDYAANGDQHHKDVDTLGQQAMANPTQGNIDAYVHSATWLREAEQAAANNPEAADFAPGDWSAVQWNIPKVDAWLTQAHSQAGALWGIFAALDDDLGVLRDLNHEQELTEARHEAWLGENAHRTAIAGFIRSLTRADGAEVAGMLNYRYREHDIAMTPEQGDTMMDVQREILGIRAKEAALQREDHPLLRGNQDPSLLDESAVELAGRREAQLSRVRPFLPDELQGEALAVVREYRYNKIDNLSSGHGSAQIAERIALWRMDDWLDNQAPAHYAFVERRHTLLYADRQSFLPRHVLGTWFADHRVTEHQDWLGELTYACLSALCVREQGAMQAYDMVRDNTGGGVFSLLINGWSPGLSELLNDGTRLGELENALAAENVADTRAMLNAMMDPAEVAALSRLASNLNGLWGLAIARIAAGIVKRTEPLLGPMIIVRLSGAAHFVRDVASGTKKLAQGTKAWRVTGELADNLKAFTDQVADGIKQGTLRQVQRWDGAKRAGGVLPLTVLALNIANAYTYARSSEALEEEGTQRQAERLSAYLYTGAALASVMQTFVLEGMKKNEFVRAGVVAPTMTLFGGVVGILSGGAAILEGKSLRKQLAQAQAGIDPYLDMRRFAVDGQTLFYGSQALLGFSLTTMRMAGMLSTTEAIKYFRLGMAPLNWLLLAAGGLYLYAWWQQETGLQSFLSQCCWGADKSRRRWDDSPQGQSDEFLALLQLLYSPQVQAESVSVPSTDPRIATRPHAPLYTQALGSLTLALPAAEPGSAKVGVRIYGERDLAREWANSLSAAWIPADDGQGLLLTGHFARPVSRLEVQVGYHSPLPLLSGSQGDDAIIGGPRGIRFAITSDGLVTPLYADDPTPRLEACELVTLTPEQLTPKDNSTR